MSYEIVKKIRFTINASSPPPPPNFNSYKVRGNGVSDRQAKYGKQIMSFILIVVLFVSVVSMEKPEEYIGWNKHSEAWRCFVCQKEYATKPNARRHFREVHCAQQESQCNVCLKWFSNERYKNKHFGLCHKKGM